MSKVLSSRNKNKILDTIQAVWVYTCVGSTLGAGALIGYNIYDYFMNVRPLKVELEAQIQEELLKEGRMLRDTAVVNN